MGPNRAVAFAVLLVALAGCAGGADEQAERSVDSESTDEDTTGPEGNRTGDAEEPPAFDGPVRFIGCTMGVTRIAVDEATARGAVPDGFEPQKFNGAVPAAGVPIGENIVVVGVLCQETANDTAELGASGLFLTYYDVVPPPEYRDDDSDGYRFVTFVAAGSEALVDALAAQGIAMDIGTVGGTHTKTAGDHADVLREVDVPHGTVAWQVSAASQGPFDTFTLRFFTADEDGQVRSGFDFVSAAGASFHSGVAHTRSTGTWDFRGEEGGLGFAYLPVPDQESLRLEPFEVEGLEDEDADGDGAYPRIGLYGAGRT